MLSWKHVITAASPLNRCSSHRALQEAQEIFGGDFDFADFDADAYDQGEEEEEDQDEEGWDRPKKQTKRRQGRKSIFEIYEPSELESSHMTDQDNEIRTTDMPERFQVCVGHSFCWQWCWYAVVKFSTSVLLPDGVCLTISRPDFVLCLTVTIHPCETCWGWWAGRRSWVDLQTWLLHSYYLHAGTTSDITYSGKTHAELPKMLPD